MRPRVTPPLRALLHRVGRIFGALALFAFSALLALPASASTLTRERLSELFPLPLTVGERDATLPVWPLFKNDLTSTVLVGYVFESIDFAPVPGYSGTPVNLLIALDAKGVFLDVKVLSHHEPVFLEGLGEAPLFRFVDQYKGLALQQSIKIGSNQNRGGRVGSANVYIDGVSKATASVRIINQSLLSASLAIARAKLGFAAGRDPDLIGRVKGDLYEALDFAALERKGLVTQRVWRNSDIEAAFKGTVGEGQDPVALQSPDAVFSEMLVAHLNVPSVGRNLLTPAAWDFLTGWLEPGDHAFLVVTRGRYSFMGDDYAIGAVPDRLTLGQGGLPLEIRDFNVEGRPRLPEAWLGPDARWRIFKVINQASLDPSQPLDFALSVTRSKGQILPERERKEFTLRAQLPTAYAEQPRSNEKTWHSIWSGRAWELALLVVALAGLSLVLARPGWLVQSTQRLERIRLAWLAFTLVFIGWYAQGQLSIVNFTALVHALMAGRSLDFFLYDPMTVLLWAFVVISLIAWGRGTFCGWLCPFGALQEFVARLARRVRLPQLKLHTRIDARLKKLKYVVLVGIVATAFVSPAWTDRLVEVEPFKTSITLMFDRSWPYLLWAVALLALNAVVYKAYCRYLCPLGAGLAVLGRIRLLNWLPRRAECGQPCQTCRHKCEYQAIEPVGKIDYAECFQCMDCVAIHDSDQLCAPRIMATRKGRVIPVHALPPGPAHPPAMHVSP
ncbi:MAG: 4Fe-4S binding protein [Rhizobacter sp.]|nr:4Fe-4S binding protein [Rhizobacter sp.]